jgi:hypothetical protein
MIYKLKSNVNYSTQRKLHWEQTRILIDFKFKLINELSGSNFVEISENHCIMSEFYVKNKHIQIPYKKDWLYSAFEIGLDMV